MKRNAVAGIVGIAALAGGAIVVAQQGQQDWPRPGQPGQPGQTTRQTQPGTPGMPGVRDEARQTLEHARELARLTEQTKEQLTQKNQQLLDQLEQARNAQGEAKIDQLIQVVEGILDEHDSMVQNMVKVHAMAINYELKQADVSQTEIAQLEQEFSFLREHTGTIRGIPMPDLEEDKDSDKPVIEPPDRPGGLDDPTGPR